MKKQLWLVVIVAAIALTMVGTIVVIMSLPEGEIEKVCGDVTELAYGGGSGYATIDYERYTISTADPEAFERVVSYLKPQVPIREDVCVLVQGGNIVDVAE